MWESGTVFSEGEVGLNEGRNLHKRVSAEAGNQPCVTLKPALRDSSLVLNLMHENQTNFGRD